MRLSSLPVQRYGKLKARSGGEGTGQDKNQGTEEFTLRSFSRSILEAILAQQLGTHHAAL